MGFELRSATLENNSLFITKIYNEDTGYPSLVFSHASPEVVFSKNKFRVEHDGYHSC